MFKSGVGILALFGLGWWLLGTSGFAGPVRLAAVVVGCLVTVGLLLIARHRFLGGTQVDPLADPGRRRRFNQINALQWLVIVAVVAACASTGAQGLIPSLVAVTVGLHFFPLAATFEQPRLKLPGALLVAVGAAGAVIGWAGGSDAFVREVVGGGAALSLWATATWTIVSMTAADSHVSASS
ncbi:hypothetical protein ADK52_20560 [Streptomyces sp. WM6372]|uniref:hypothetical protein n=1 Tax=Streptomyces sp. WM6372 TaxID=1415555 RepID=UPI0006AE14E4|nr:hypothetical protein [Streptomyces sp. WM6372]KOU22604.1 hypothetical protein ADK52_20560 [Streptomyces sp. WM6372]